MLKQATSAPSLRRKIALVETAESYAVLPFTRIFPNCLLLNQGLFLTYRWWKRGPQPSILPCFSDLRTRCCKTRWLAPPRTITTTPRSFGEPARNDRRQGGEESRELTSRSLWASYMREPGAALAPRCASSTRLGNWSPYKQQGCSNTLSVYQGSDRDEVSWQKTTLVDPKREVWQRLGA